MALAEVLPLYRVEVLEPPVGMKSVLDEFEKQSEAPPGKDRYIGAANRAILELVHEGHPWKDFLTKVVVKRHFNPQQLVNLWFRAVQYVKLYERETDGYPSGYDQVNKWRGELDAILRDHELGVEKILLDKNTGTTIYQRYAGPRAILAALGASTVIDLGCGGNHGLRGIDIGEPFKRVKDGTGGVFAAWMGGSYGLEMGVGVDKENPDDPEVAKWRMACSFYPGELHTMADFSKFEQRLKRSKRVKFEKADLFKISPTDSKYHAAILSTTLYMVPHRQDELKVVLDRLADFAVIQDFAEVDPATSKFSIKSFGEEYGYRTFVLGQKLTGGKVWEVFRWNNGRCLSVKPGIDFKKFCAIVDLKGGE